MISAQTFSLDGRLALITGSSTGIGFALARGLAQAGAEVIINARSTERVHQAVETLRQEGHKVHAQVFDVTREDQVQQGIARIEQDIGPLHILVNNAGMTRRAPLHEFTFEAWQQIMQTNLDSVFLVSRAVVQHMLPRKSGRIINICSVQSELGRPGISPYMATKGGLKMLTKGMAIDWGPHGINVNGLGPGYFKTELTQALVNDDTFSNWLTQRTPSRRWGNVEELAPAVVFLASDAGAFVNGHVLYVDGGVTAQL
jgi:gluconate 5-dehydrogenase